MTKLILKLKDNDDALLDKAATKLGVDKNNAENMEEARAFIKKL